MEPDVFECGCVATYKRLPSGDYQMVLSPCRLGCPTVGDILDQAREASLPVRRERR